jgi:molybdopterin synthase sulfur carrier subunit
MKPIDSAIATIEVLYFARLREAFGRERERIELPGEIRDVAALTTWLRSRGDAWERELASGRPVRIAVNQDMAGGATPLADGDEVAFFPPVTGG